MYLLNWDLLDAPLHSRNMTFPKSNVKYKHNLPCKVRASSSRHLNAGESRSDLVLCLRQYEAWGGEDTLPSGGNVSEGKPAPIWSLQAEALLARVRQEENASALEGTGCWGVECGQPSPTGTSGVPQNRISLLSVLCGILRRSAPAAGIVAES